MKACKFVENVSRGFVIKRDKYKCQICFTHVFETDSHHHPQYPNIDHIIPLSKGGEHSYANVQLTCRSCNCGDKKDN